MSCFGSTIMCKHRYKQMCTKLDTGNDIKMQRNNNPDEIDRNMYRQNNPDEIARNMTVICDSKVYTDSQLNVL